MIEKALKIEILSEDEVNIGELMSEFLTVKKINFEEIQVTNQPNMVCFELGGDTP